MFLEVEIGQILALIFIVFVIIQLRKQKQFPAFYKAVNWYIVMAGIFLFIYQLYAYSYGH